MEYSEDKQKMDEWAPLMMAGRSAKDRLESHGLRTV